MTASLAVKAALLLLLPALCSSFSLLPATPLAAARIVQTGSSRRLQHASIVMAKKGGSTKAKGGFGASGGAKGGFAAAPKQQQAPAEAAASAPAAAAAMPGMPEVEKFDLGDGTQFMGAFVIKDETIIDNLVADFKSKSDKHLRGMVSMEGGAMPKINKDIKDSYEMSYGPADKIPAWQRYLGALGSVMQQYVAEYPMSGAYGKFALVSRSNLQLYPPSGGYKTFHTERTGAQQPEGSRHLVFMTYLNDVTDEGGTEFYHQKVTITPRKGLTLVWPADWTFTHRGVPSPSQEKMIVTGWFNFIG